ncbi:MAG: hypothetical protein IJA19_02045 [Clostridia bacterium]|nr:hypothetical protein [Clostridia bacterium]
MKKYIIYGIIFVSALGTLLHFTYGWSDNNFVVGLFSPVNESTWEHMKLVFFPMLLYSFAGVKKRPCLTSAMAFAILFGTLLMPALFYTYSGILGFNVAFVDISIFFICVFSAFYVANKYAKNCKMQPYKKLLNLIVIAFAVLFVVFTVYPPNIGLFVAP